jgi:hypothetical protein
MLSSHRSESCQDILKHANEIIANAISMYNNDNDACSIVKQKVAFSCFDYFKPMVLFLISTSHGQKYEFVSFFLNCSIMNII